MWADLLMYFLIWLVLGTVLALLFAPLFKRRVH